MHEVVDRLKNEQRSAKKKREKWCEETRFVQNVKWRSSVQMGGTPEEKGKKKKKPEITTIQDVKAN